MARKDETPVFSQYQRVVAAHDLPGIPAGTPGKVLLINGLSWVRYRVLFDNGVERGMLSAPDLITPEVFAASAKARRDAERAAERERIRAAARAEANEGSAA